MSLLSNWGFTINLSDAECCWNELPSAPNSPEFHMASPPFWIPVGFGEPTVEPHVQTQKPIALPGGSTLLCNSCHLVVPQWSRAKEKSCRYIIWLVVSTPLKNMISSDWIIIPTLGENNPNVPNHQPSTSHISLCHDISHVETAYHQRMIWSSQYGGVRQKWKGYPPSMWKIGCSMIILYFSPPARWGLLDFMSVASSCLLLTPASSSSSSSSSSSPPRPPRPPCHPCRPCRPRRPRRPRRPCSTATCDTQCSLPDLNHDHPRPVFPAGPRPRPATPSVPCRTSTTTSHAQCSLPDLICEYPCQVFPAGPHVGR